MCKPGGRLVARRLNHSPSSSSSKCEVIRAVLLIFNQSCKPDPEAKLHFLHLICFFQFRETHCITCSSFICDLCWTRSPANHRVAFFYNQLIVSFKQKQLGFSSFCLNIFVLFFLREKYSDTIRVHPDLNLSLQLIIFGLSQICCWDNL